MDARTLPASNAAPAAGRSLYLGDESSDATRPSLGPAPAAVRTRTITPFLARSKYAAALAGRARADTDSTVQAL